MRIFPGLVRPRLVAAAVLASVALFGCEGPGEVAPPAAGGPPSEDSSVGSVQLQLQIAGSVQLDAVHFRLTRGSFEKTGDLDVSSSNALSGLISPLPAGTGYAISLAATDVAHKLAGCQGSSMFDVAPGAVTPVAVHLTCHEVGKQAPPVSVPIPRWASLALALLLALAGAMASKRAGRPKTEREDHAHE